MATAAASRVAESSAPAAEPPRAGSPFWQYPWFLGLVGSGLFWAALPPLNCWPLGWLAAAPLVLLARQDALPGRRPYWTLYAIGVLFWLASVYWLTLPHWATSFGWLAISIYLGVYLPLTVGLLRVAVHRLGLSPVIAAPVIWTGLELARAHVLTGFLMAALGHTQVRRLAIIQISDLGGAYLVSFLLVLVAASIATLIPWAGKRGVWWPVALLVAAPLGAWQYGSHRLTASAPSAGLAASAPSAGLAASAPSAGLAPGSKPSPVVALIQGSVSTELKSDPDGAKRQQIFAEYFGLSKAAADQVSSEGSGLNLIVWPETMFREPWFTFSDDFRPPAQAGWTVSQAREATDEIIARASRRLGAPALLGIDTVHCAPGREERFNSALFVDRQGRAIARYDKCYLVMFGEYVPLASRYPYLYKLTPLSGGLDAGRGAESAEIDGIRYAPNICYETTSPHRMRDHVNELRARGEEPDVLVNLTNDGWFWGSSELDMHLACGVFRAIEARKPLLVAANTGFSAWIEASGEIRAQGGRQTSEFLIARPTIVHRDSFYLDHGDWFAGTCLAACAGLALVGAVDRRRQRRAASAA